MKTSNPLVSIVVPCYNQSHYLSQAIESILSQDYSPIELIAIDDGSTDNTRTVLDSYGDRFFWESHPNMGQAKTLNRAWGMARGEILGYLSADDLLLPGCVSAAVELLRSLPEIVLTYCDFELVDPHSRVVRMVQAAEFEYSDMVVNLVCPPGPGAFFRRSAFQRAGGWDSALRQMPDYDYWLRLGLTGAFRRIPRSLAAFRVHEGSATFSSASPERAQEPVRILDKYFGLAEVPAAIRLHEVKARSNAHLVSGQLHLRAGRYTAAFDSVRRAATMYPRNLLQPRAIRQLANGLFNRLGHRLLWYVKRPGAMNVRP